MQRKSGCRIDPKPCGECELTYFGNFSLSIQSQTLRIRSKTDLIDIMKHIEEYLNESEKDTTRESTTTKPDESK